MINISMLVTVLVMSQAISIYDVVQHKSHIITHPQLNGLQHHTTAHVQQDSSLTELVDRNAYELRINAIFTRVPNPVLSLC